MGEPQLLGALHRSIAAGLALVAIEAYPNLRWIYHGGGVAVLSKPVLPCAVPILWGYRVPILLAVAGIATVGSHTPSRRRYFSLMHRRVLEHRKGACGR
jgi:hypothetical protein